MLQHHGYNLNTKPTNTSEQYVSHIDKISQRLGFVHCGDVVIWLTHVMYGDRSSWSGSWTLSFDNNEDHSCKPASHCLLRESTPINTKDSNSLPKPPDFAWPQSQQSSTSRLVTPPIVRWSRTKPTQLSPAVKKALSYHGSTQKGEQYRYGSICTTSKFFCMSCLSQAVAIMALQMARSFVTVMLC